MKPQTAISSLNTTVSNTTQPHYLAKSSMPASSSLGRIASILTLITILCLWNFQLFGQATSTSGKSLIVPPLVNYSGVLKDVNGKPLTGTVGATFYIYKDSEGGAPLWTETQNLQLDTSGHYSVMLGSTTSRGLPEDLFAFGEPRWLSLQVQGEQEQPRALLVAVPYALKAADAATIGGLPPSAFVRATPEGTSSMSGSGPPLQIGSSSSSQSNSGKSAPSLYSPCGGLTGSGTTNYLPLWTSGCNLGNSAISQSGGGYVGIGTATPGAKLDVLGNDSLPQAAGMRVSTPTFPQYLFNATNGASNAKIWRMIGRGSNDFEIQTLNDSYGGEVTAMQINRNGTSIKNVDFPNGVVGIGTTTPGAKLDVVAPNQVGLFVEGPVAGVGAGMQLQATGVNGVTWEILNAGFGSSQGYGKLNFRISGAIGPFDLFTIEAKAGFNSPCVTGGIGCVGIGVTSPTNILTVQQSGGHVLADGYDTYSSRRWKTNIKTLQNALPKVEQLRGVSYELTGSNKREIGVIAEEVGAVVPEIVSWENNGTDARGVDYSRLTALLIEAVKQQQHEIEGQQAELVKAVSQLRKNEVLLRAQAVELASLKTQVRAAHEKMQTATIAPQLLVAVKR